MDWKVRSVTSCLISEVDPSMLPYLYRPQPFDVEDGPSNLGRGVKTPS